LFEGGKPPSKLTAEQSACPARACPARELALFCVFRTGRIAKCQRFCEFLWRSKPRRELISLAMSIKNIREKIIGEIR